MGGVSLARFEVGRSKVNGRIENLTARDAIRTRFTGFLPSNPDTGKLSTRLGQLFFHATAKRFIAAGTEKAIERLRTSSELLVAADNALSISGPILRELYEMPAEVKSMLEGRGFALCELGRTGKYLIGLTEEATALSTLKTQLESPESGAKARELITDYFGITVTGADRLTDSGWLELHRLLILAGPVEEVLTVGDDGKTRHSDGSRYFSADRLIGPKGRIASVQVDDLCFGQEPNVTNFLGILRIRSARLNNPGRAAA